MYARNNARFALNILYAIYLSRLMIFEKYCTYLQSQSSLLTNYCFKQYTFFYKNVNCMDNYFVTNNMQFINDTYLSTFMGNFKTNSRQA